MKIPEHDILVAEWSAVLTAARHPDQMPGLVPRPCPSVRSDH